MPSHLKHLALLSQIPQILLQRLPRRCGIRHAILEINHPRRLTLRDVFPPMHARPVHAHVAGIQDPLLATIQGDFHRAVRNDAVPHADATVEVRLHAWREVDGADDGAVRVVGRRLVS